MEINSINDLQTTLPKDIDTTKNEVYFRGHADNTYSLVPSIYRENRWICNEDIMIQDFLLMCPDDFSNTNSCFDKLVKMQHYDFPTRLLDITSNPLVALYFACISEKDKDGELIIFTIPKNEIKYSGSDTVSVISNISHMDNQFQVSNEHSSTYKSNKYGQQYHHFISQEKPYFIDKINVSDMQKVLCVKPKLDNRRIIRQEGAFLIFGMKGSKRYCAQIPQNYKYNPTFKIPKKSKDALLEELEVLGITTAKLFPEIDSVAKFLKSRKQYTETEFQKEDDNDWLDDFIG